MSTPKREFASLGETNFGSQTPSATEPIQVGSLIDDAIAGTSAEVSPEVNDEVDALTSQGALSSWRNESFRIRTQINKVVTILGATDLRPLSFKTDGSRFDLDTTIKLNVNSSYQISFNFRPVVRVERLEIMGDVKTPTETARDIESITYMAYFDTKAKETSKKGGRSKIHITLDLGEHGHLNYDIQAKFYAEKNDNHVSWGNPLHQIELEASSVDGEVKVSKTTFR